MTLTQLTQSITYTSWACRVRGDTTRSERMLKIRNSPAGCDPSFFQGLSAIYPGSLPPAGKAWPWDGK